MNIVPPKPALPPLSPDMLARFKAIVGDKYAVTDANELTQYVTEERNLFHGHSPLVLRPASTAEVSAICKLATEHRIALVPQGGNTGLVGGQTPHNGEVVVSMRRMDRIREVDVASNTMTVEAGVVLQNAQQRASKVDRFFPLSLGAEGSCTIGGNLSTNAGGTGALAFGVAREMTGDANGPQLVRGAAARSACHGSLRQPSQRRTAAVELSLNGLDACTARRPSASSQARSC